MTIKGDASQSGVPGRIAKIGLVPDRAEVSEGSPSADSWIPLAKRKRGTSVLGLATNISVAEPGDETPAPSGGASAPERRGDLSPEGRIRAASSAARSTRSLRQAKGHSAISAVTDAFLALQAPRRSRSRVMSWTRTSSWRSVAEVLLAPENPEGRQARRCNESSSRLVSSARQSPDPRRSATVRVARGLTGHSKKNEQRRDRDDVRTPRRVLSRWSSC
jgi:hypothetical protein